MARLSRLCTITIVLLLSHPVLYGGTEGNGANELIQSEDGQIYFLSSNLFQAFPGDNLVHADSQIAQLNDQLQRNLRVLENFQAYHESRSKPVDNCFVSRPFHQNGADLLRTSSETPTLLSLASKSPTVFLGKVLSVNSGFFPGPTNSAGQFGRTIEIRVLDRIKGDAEVPEIVHLVNFTYDFTIRGHRYCKEYPPEFFRPKPGVSVFLLASRNSTAPDSFFIPHLFLEVAGDEILPDGGIPFNEKQSLRVSTLKEQLKGEDFDDGGDQE